MALRVRLVPVVSILLCTPVLARAQDSGAVVDAFASGPGLSVLARINFERGSAWNTYVWGPNGIQGVLPAPDPPASDYRPVSETAFESFRLRGSPGSRIELRNTGDAGSAGDTPVLVIYGPDGPVEARRG